MPFDIERGVPEIWLYDAVSGAGRKTVFGPGIRSLPVWSPDSGDGLGTCPQSRKRRSGRWSQRLSTGLFILALNGSGRCQP